MAHGLWLLLRMLLVDGLLALGGCVLLVVAVRTLANITR